MDKQELRFLSNSAPETTGRKISGYAALFEVRSDNLGGTDNPVYEIIKPGAFDDVLLDDVRALVNHDPSMVLARSNQGKGTLKLSVDSKGLRYEFEAPETSYANDLLESIKRKDITGSSYAFRVAPGGDSYTFSNGETIRTITKVARLFDVSPVAYPATLETTVDARSKPQAAQPHFSVTNARRMFELL